METVLDRPENDVVLSQPLDQEAAVIDFSVCYARELSSLVRFVMSLGADAHRAADAQSARTGVVGYTSYAHCRLR